MEETSTEAPVLSRIRRLVADEHNLRYKPALDEG
jgi:hypothetical protein